MQVFSPEGQFLRKFDACGWSHGICFDPSEQFVFSPTYNVPDVKIFTLAGKLVASFGKEGPGQGELEGPVCVAFDKDGRLLTLEFLKQMVQVWNVDHVCVWTAWLAVVVIVTPFAVCL